MSELVAAALADDRPPTRAIVGGGARAITAFGRLPDRVQDAIVARLLARVARRAGH